MNKSVIKPILFGVLFGALAYTAPFFLLKAVCFFAILGGIFRFFQWRHYSNHGMYHLAFADIVRNMSEEDYNKFKTRFNFGSNCCQGKHEHQSTSNPQ